MIDLSQHCEKTSLKVGNFQGNQKARKIDRSKAMNQSDSRRTGRLTVPGGARHFRGGKSNLDEKLLSGEAC